MKFRLWSMQHHLNLFDCSAKMITMKYFDWLLIGRNRLSCFLLVFEINWKQKRFFLVWPENQEKILEARSFSRKYFVSIRFNNSKVSILRSVVAVSKINLINRKKRESNTPTENRTEKTTFYLANERTFNVPNEINEDIYFRSIELLERTLILIIDRLSACNNKKNYPATDLLRVILRCDETNDDSVS